MAGKNFAQLDQGAGAKAASEGVDDLGLVVKELGKKAQGKYTVTLLLSAASAEELRENTPLVHRTFVDAQATVIEETIGNLSAFYAMFPFNQRYNVFSLWLGEDHHARLSPVFAPNIGHPKSEDLDSEYLNVFETRQGTPFFHDAYVSDGVRVQLTIGPPGTGKSVHTNQMLALERKYHGFTFIFRHRQQLRKHGGAVRRQGGQDRSGRPAREPVRLGADREEHQVSLQLRQDAPHQWWSRRSAPEDEDAVFKEVQGMYLIDRKIRRLSGTCCCRSTSAGISPSG